MFFIGTAQYCIRACLLEHESINVQLRYYTRSCQRLETMGLLMEQFDVDGEESGGMQSRIYSWIESINWQKKPLGGSGLALGDLAHQVNESTNSMHLSSREEPNLKD